MPSLPQAQRSFDHDERLNGERLSGRAFGGDKMPREGKALAAFGTATKMGIGAVRRVEARLDGFTQLLLPNRVANANQHSQ